MFEYNREVLLKELEESFKLYGFKGLKPSDVSVVADSDFFSLSYSVGNSVFSVSYSGDNAVTLFTSSFKYNDLHFTFERNYDINKLESDGEDVFSYILNYEGYYGNKLVSEFVKENSKDLLGYEVFSQCLSDILLSVLGYADK